MMSRCTNGGCTKPLYSGKECFRCWLGTKWDSMQQRVRNRDGHYHTYEGIPLGFNRKEFIQWGIDNPPPLGMLKPSIDRIEPRYGYVFGNIRWLSVSKNASGPQRDIPDGFKSCPRCKNVYRLHSDFFPPRKKRWGAQFDSYCHSCLKAKRGKK